MPNFFLQKQSQSKMSILLSSDVNLDEVLTYVCSIGVENCVRVSNKAQLSVERRLQAAGQVHVHLALTHSDLTHCSCYIKRPHTGS